MAAPWVTNDRRKWFLPLVGGAELNRLTKPPPPARFLLSRPYPFVLEEEFTGEPNILRSLSIPEIEPMEGRASLLGGELVATTRFTATNQRENMNGRGRLVSGSLELVTRYSTQNQLENTTGQAKLVSGTLEVTTRYVTYDRYPTENVNGRGRLLSGTLA